jgi:hypothetical protein
MKLRIFAVLAVVAVAFAAVPQVHAQRSLVLHPPTSVIEQPNKFRSGNEFVFADVQAGINAKTVALTSFGALQAAPSTAKFVVTQIKIETTAATAITAGAVFTVGSTGTSTSSLLGSTTLANTPAVGGFETYNPKAGALVLAAGDTPTISFTTGATGTSQTVRAHLIGYWFAP